MNQFLIQLLRSVLYITVLLIAEKNKEVCFLASDLFHFIIQIQPEQKCYSLSLSQDIIVRLESSLNALSG